MKIERICLYFLIFSISMLTICRIAFYHYREQEFSDPIPILLEEKNNNGYIGKFELEPNVNYGLVVSGIVDNSYNHTKTFMAFIDGKRIFLQGGKSDLLKNLQLDFRWIEKSRIFFETRYYGYFSLSKPCSCILTIKGHSPNRIKEYKLRLYKNVDESYFWLGWITLFCFILVIAFGCGYILIRIILEIMLKIKVCLYRIKARMLKKF